MGLISTGGKPAGRRGEVTALLDITRRWAGERADLEFGVVSPAWATTEPIDPGTYAVASRGLLALYDPEGLLGRLVEAIVG